MKALIVLGVSVVAIVVLLLLSFNASVGSIEPTQDSVRSAISEGELDRVVDSPEKIEYARAYYKSCVPLEGEERRECLRAYYAALDPIVQEQLQVCSDCEELNSLLAKRDASFCEVLSSPIPECEPE